MLFTVTVSASADAEAVIYLNGERLNMASVMVQNRVMVPGDEIFEALGARFQLHEFDMIYHVYTSDGNLLRMRVGNGDFILKNNFGQRVNVPLDVPLQIIGGQVFVPLRAVAEAFGAVVEWDGQVTITTPAEISHMEITVSTAEEFVNAIGSNRTIYLNPGVYDFSQWVSAPISPIGGAIGFRVMGVNNLNIIGLGDVDFTTENGITFLVEFVDNVTIENIGTPDSQGNQFDVWRSSNVTFRNITSNYFYVGGNSNTILYDNVSVIGNTATGRVTIFYSDNVVFRNSYFNHNTPNRLMFDLESADVRIENSVISHNSFNPEWERNPHTTLFHLFNYSNLVITETEIYGNTFMYGIIKSHESVIEYENDLFDDNFFEILMLEIELILVG
jgi:hypothetical protein